jgi:hypothetical protein
VDRIVCRKVDQCADATNTLLLLCTRDACFREVTASYRTNECASIHREISWSMNGSQKILWLPAALNPIQSMPVLDHKGRSTTAMERNALWLHLAGQRHSQTAENDPDQLLAPNAMRGFFCCEDFQDRPKALAMPYLG